MASPRARFGIAAGLVAISILGLIGWALSGSTAYYVTPAELAKGGIDKDDRIRVAGKVVDGSVIQQGAVTSFVVTDGVAEVEVKTEDLLPDTFGAGVEVVAEGAMTDGGVFSASTVLAKCPSKFTSNGSGRGTTAAKT